MKLTAREIWNDCMGLVLCLSGLAGVFYKVEYAGWLIFFGFLFFLAGGDEEKEKS